MIDYVSSSVLKFEGTRLGEMYEEEEDISVARLVGWGVAWGFFSGTG